jgi:hypothetical protein
MSWLIYIQCTVRLLIVMYVQFVTKGKVQQSLYWPIAALRGFQEVETPRHSYMKLVRLSALCTVPQEIFTVLISFKGWIDPRDIVQPARLSKKNVVNTICNQTHHQPVAQSEQTATVCCTVCDNADRIIYSAMCGTECLCNKTATSFWEWTLLKSVASSILHCCCIRDKYISE